MAEKFFTFREVAERYKVSPRTLGRWIHAGFFPRADLTKKQIIRWSIGLLEAWDRAQLSTVPDGITTTAPTPDDSMAAR